MAAKLVYAHQVESDTGGVLRGGAEGRYQALGIILSDHGQCLHTHQIRNDKKSCVNKEGGRRKQEAKCVLAKTKSARERRSGKPPADTSLPWAGRF